MGGGTRREYLRAIYRRYREATKEMRGTILDEFCVNCGYARKYAIRLLNGPPPGKNRPPRKRRSPIYDPRLIQILEGVWEAAGYPWSRRLKALLPQWLPRIRERYRLTPDLERQLLRISPRQIDRRLAGRKLRLRKRLYGRTKPGTLLKHHIPIKTDSWNVTVPGFTEVDLVSHSGNSADGEFIYSLNVTDIHTTWVETRAVLGKAQSRVVAALDDMRQAMPFDLKGIDADNGSEFINHHLYRYSQTHAIQFTRGRPYKKDDNAHVEQKNWTHVRKIFGYARFDSPAALQAMNDLYGNELRLFQNLFLPSVKLVKKLRVGSRVRRIYDQPQTPFDRVCAALPADHPKVAALRNLRDSLDPFRLSQTIDQKLDRIQRLACRRHSPQQPPQELKSSSSKSSALTEVTQRLGIPIIDRSHRAKHH